MKKLQEVPYPKLHKPPDIQQVSYFLPVRDKRDISYIIFPFCKVLKENKPNLEILKRKENNS